MRWLRVSLSACARALKRFLDSDRLDAGRAETDSMLRVGCIGWPGQRPGHSVSLLHCTCARLRSRWSLSSFAASSAACFSRSCTFSCASKRQRPVRALNLRSACCYWRRGWSKIQSTDRVAWLLSPLLHCSHIGCDDTQSGRVVMQDVMGNTPAQGVHETTAITLSGTSQASHTAHTPSAAGGRPPAAGTAMPPSHGEPLPLPRPLWVCHRLGAGLNPDPRRS